MKNYVRDADTLLLTPSVAVASGKLTVFGDLVVCAVNDVAANEAGPFKKTGVIEYKKKAADGLTVGLMIFYDATNDEITLTSSGNKKAGYCVTANAGPGNVQFFLQT